MTYYNADGEKYDSELHGLNGDDPLKAKQLAEFLTMRAMLEIFTDTTHFEDVSDEFRVETIAFELVDDMGRVLYTTYVDRDDLRKVFRF